VAWAIKLTTMVKAVPAANLAAEAKKTADDAASKAALAAQAAAKKAPASSKAAQAAAKKVKKAAENSAEKAEAEAKAAAEAEVEPEARAEPAAESVDTAEQRAAVTPAAAARVGELAAQRSAASAALTDLQPRPEGSGSPNEAGSPRKELFPDAPSSGFACAEIRLQSWNLFKFTFRDGNAVHRQRVQLLAAELAASQPSVLFIQEVQTGLYGKRAMRELTDALNAMVGIHEQVAANGLLSRFKCIVSGDAGDNEAYGVIWDTKSALGEEPPMLELWESALDKEPPFDIASPEDLKAARSYLSQAESVTGGFRRSPLFAFFPGLKQVLFCSVHLVSGNKSLTEVCAEALLLQAVLGAAAERWLGPLALCGDFNEDDADHHQWFAPGATGDTAYAGAPVAVHAARARFFCRLERCLDVGWATNLYPITEVAAHNDDIWVSKHGLDLARLDAGVGSINGLCDVLRLEGKDLLMGRGRGTNRSVTSNRAKLLYSDHVPVTVTLALTLPTLASAATTPSAEASYIIQLDESSPAACIDSMAGTPAAAEVRLSARAGPAPKSAPPSHNTPQPRGRPPKGNAWDSVSGEWFIPSDEQLAAQLPPRWPRPRGRAPKCKTWDYDAGDWVDLP